MADRKSRTVTFKTPFGTSLKDIKDAITKEIGADKLTVLQQLSTGEYLVETTSATFAEELQENGFTCEDQHVACHPPRGYYTNVSIMGLRAYVDDDSIIEALTQYGEIKSAVIRLKYKSDHDLAGLENGNRLVRMVLSKPSIPYSIKIGDEWCRIIHSNQQPICSECHEVGHSRRRCPQIICRNCNGHGHMARDCVEEPAPPPPDPDHQHDETSENTAPEENITEPETTTLPQTEEPPTTSNSLRTSNKPESTCSPPLSTTTTPQDMDLDPQKGQKRAHVTDSDSDNTQQAPPRRNRINPAPNLSAGKPRSGKASKM